jgi:metal-responsive CopG/Arc/MetJ family transcriptional regulator
MAELFPTKDKDILILQNGLKMNKDSLASLDTIVQKKQLTRGDIVRMAINEYVKQEVK